MIAALDPGTAARIDLLNPARAQRAWEVLHATGRGLWPTGRPTRRAPPTPLAQAQPLVLMPDRDRSAARIDRRFRMMMDQGALDQAGPRWDWWDPSLPAAQAASGAPELVAHLRGEVASTRRLPRHRRPLRRKMPSGNMDPVSQPDEDVGQRIDLPTSS